MTKTFEDMIDRGLCNELASDFIRSGSIWDLITAKPDVFNFLLEHIFRRRGEAAAAQHDDIAGQDTPEG